MEITLTAQIGGQNAGEILLPLIVSLRKSLKYIQDDYSSQVNKFRVQIRISGEISEYKEKTGIHYLNLMKKTGYVSGEIVWEKEAWINKTSTEIVLYLCNHIEELFLGMINKLKNSNIQIEEERLMSDLKNIVLKKFKKDNL